MSERENRPVLTAACAAHLVQDGLVALQFVFLPVLAQSLGLSYAQVGLLKAISSTATAAMEIPSGLLAEKTGERRLLMFGLVGAGLGYFGIAHAQGYALIALCFALAGIGAGFQHSLASALLVRTFASGARRRALGTYNAAGDAGKLTFTALFGVAVGAGMAWDFVVAVLAVVAILAGFGVWRALQGAGEPVTAAERAEGAAVRGWGILHRSRFAALVSMILLVGMVQELFLTFVAFMALSKGLGASAAAAAVTLALAGGMVGKFACGHAAARLGDRTTFVLLQGLAGVGLVAIVLVPGALLLALLPFVGLVVQGSSTVTYGSVADHALEGRQARVYSLVYTVSNGSSLIGPLAFGLIADAYGLDVGFMVLAGLTCLTLPLSLVLSGRLATGVPSSVTP